MGTVWGVIYFRFYGKVSLEGCPGFSRRKYGKSNYLTISIIDW